MRPDPTLDSGAVETHVDDTLQSVRSVLTHLARRAPLLVARPSPASPSASPPGDVDTFGDQVSVWQTSIPGATRVGIDPSSAIIEIDFDHVRHIHRWTHLLCVPPPGHIYKSDLRQHIYLATAPVLRWWLRLRHIDTEPLSAAFPRWRMVA